MMQSECSLFNGSIGGESRSSVSTNGRQRKGSKKSNRTLVKPIASERSRKH